MKSLLLMLSATLMLPSQANAAGAIALQVTQKNISSTICVSGYTKTVRPSVNYTNRIKKSMLSTAGIEAAASSRFELDHIIPLALGGHPSALANFQLQPWEGGSGARRKDVLEVKLQCLVCEGKISLEEAQREIAGDWLVASRKHALDICARPSTNRVIKHKNRVGKGGYIP